MNDDDECKGTAVRGRVPDKSIDFLIKQCDDRIFDSTQALPAPGMTYDIRDALIELRWRRNLE